MGNGKVLHDSNPEDRVGSSVEITSNGNDVVAGAVDDGKTAEVKSNASSKKIASRSSTVLSIKRSIKTASISTIRSTDSSPYIQYVGLEKISRQLMVAASVC